MRPPSLLVLYFARFRAGYQPRALPISVVDIKSENIGNPGIFASPGDDQVSELDVAADPALIHGFDGGQVCLAMPSTLRLRSSTSRCTRRRRQMSGSTLT